ncbi:MAG: hypothetical protein HN348_05390 [Proteobacteria bacterium]|jgi:hypothetical protein|nr:hypothetical protein [Pseudomonadota bacterium]
MRQIAWVALLLPGLALAGTPRASSELQDAERVRHKAAMAFDGLLKTGWAEGASGDGDGEWIELPLDGSMQVRSVSIWSGNLEGGIRTLREYGRPHTVTISLTSKSGEKVEKQIRILDPVAEGPSRVDVPLDAVATAVRVTLDKTYTGGIHNDTFIAEIAVNFDDGEQPRAVENIQSWLESDSGRSSQEREKTRIVDLYDKIKTGEFGDRDSLREIMNSASDGAPHVRQRVSQQVPYGFRMQALPPSQAGVDALLKIKDANAIPALEMAAIRSRGAAERKLMEQVEVFYAYQQLIGGGSFNIAPWGQEGFEKGAFQGFGEPMGIVLDSYGRVFVTDIGNNRVQRFNFQGICEKQWGGGEPELANVWFGGKRTWYVSGQKPGKTSGSFSTPVALTLIPDKVEERVAVLDGTGRVQLLIDEGGATTLFEVPVEFPLSPNVGGEGYLVYVKNKLVVIWGNKSYIYSMEGESLGDFVIEDGVPTGAVSYKGRVALIFGNDLVVYDLDGFRQGGILGDTLGSGFEAWDATFDDKGKLWAILDNGWAIKYKKPGKIDFKVQYSNELAQVPRAAVYDDMVFVIHDDAVDKFDALEELAKADMNGSP